MTSLPKAMPVRSLLVVNGFKSTMFDTLAVMLRGIGIFFLVIGLSLNLVYFHAVGWRNQCGRPLH